MTTSKNEAPASYPTITVEFVPPIEGPKTYTLHENYQHPDIEGHRFQADLGIWQFVLADGRSVTLHAAHVVSLTYDNGTPEGQD